MKIELLRNPLEQYFEKERKILLIVTAVGIAVAWANFLPQGFDVIGIKIGQLDPTGFTWMLALVILYFLISFSAHAVMDWKSWQWKLIKPDGEQTFETLSELNRHIVPERKVVATALTVFFTNKIVFSKIVFDLFLPFVIGIYALVELFGWKPPEPPAAKIVSIIHSEQPEVKKSSIVFINSGTTFVADGNAESLATIIVPFKDEAACDGNSPRQWTGAAVDETHKPFLTQLGQDLSECGTENNPMRLQVRGFASSSKMDDFSKCGNASSSDEANLLIANARRDNVIHYLSKNKGKFLQIDSFDWKGDFKKMEQQRFYIDRLMSNEYSKARGQLNRRVEIHLLNAGACDISKI